MPSFEQISCILTRLRCGIKCLTIPVHDITLSRKICYFTKNLLLHITSYFCKYLYRISHSCKCSLYTKPINIPHKLTIRDVDWRNVALVYLFMWKDNAFVTHTLHHKKCTCCQDTMSIGWVMAASVTEERRMLHNLTHTKYMSSSRAKPYIWVQIVHGPSNR